MIDYVDSPSAPGYRPGACNIGPAELERRRRSAIALTGITALVAVALVAAGVPPILRLAVAPFAASAVVSWQQVIRRFCVAFGALGVRNFGALGQQVRVEDEQARAADRRLVVRVLVESGLAGLAFAALLVALPI